MTQTINESVSVSLTYDSTSKKANPKSIVWNNRLYPITKVGLHHTVKEGEKLLHIFSVATPTLFFKLVFDTSNLQWMAAEIADGFNL